MSRKILACGAAGLLAGVLVPLVAIASARSDAADGFISAAHFPPLLTVPGERVELRYQILCPPPSGDLASGEACDAGGDVYVRAGHAGAFRRFQLTRGMDSANGRYFVDLPADIASSPDGFSYYAVLRDEAHRTTTMLPAAGAEAPQNSYRLATSARVDVGVHRFGETRGADARIVDAHWGSRAGEVGVDATRIGPSAFDVAADGTVTVLDEINGRIERFRGGAVTAVRLTVPPVLDDMSVTDGGAIYVADGTSADGETPLLRTFAGDGTLRAVQHLAERTWSQVRVGPAGAVVQQHPSEQWMPPARPERGFAGRPLGDGSRLVVLREGASEVRIARVLRGLVHDAWRIVSGTPLAEVQLADIVGGRLVVVVKTYTETRDEYEAIVVDSRGSARRFSIAPSEWAQAAPLGRFRLEGRSLFYLGSTTDGAFVDRFDLAGAA